MSPFSINIYQQTMLQGLYGKIPINLISLQAKVVHSFEVADSFIFALDVFSVYK